MKHGMHWWVTPILIATGCDTRLPDAGRVTAVPERNEPVPTREEPRGFVQDDTPLVPEPHADPIPPPPDEPAPDEPLVTGPVSSVHALAGSSYRPVVSIDGAGNALAVWTQQRDVAPYFAVYASRRERGAGWQAPVMVADWAQAMPSQLTLAGGADGRAVLAWLAGELFVSDFVPARGWSRPVSLAATPVSGYLIGPRVALSENGAAVVAWATTSWDGSAGVALHARYCRGGAAWEAGEELGPIATGGAYHIDVALDPAGRLLLAWIDDSGDEIAIWALRGHRQDGSAGPVGWDPAALVAAYGAPDAPGRGREIWAGLDAEGTADVTWVMSAGSWDRLTVGGARAARGAAFTAPEVIVEELPAMFGYEQSLPRLASNGAGEMLLAWRHSDVTTWSADPPPSSLVAIRRSGAGVWGASETVADQLAPPYFGCAMPGAVGIVVSLGENGDATIVWEDRDPSAEPASIRASTSRHGAGWSPAATLTAEAGGWSRDLAAAIDGGVGVALWSEDGVDEVTGVWATRLRAVAIEAH